MLSCMEHNSTGPSSHFVVMFADTYSTITNTSSPFYTESTDMFIPYKCYQIRRIHFIPERVCMYILIYISMYEYICIQTIIRCMTLRRYVVSSCPDGWLYVIAVAQFYNRQCSELPQTCLCTYVDSYVWSLVALLSPSRG